MAPFPYRLTGPIGAKATLGLIVLQVDETIEQDFRRLFADPSTALYISRIPSGADLTPETIAQMETDLPRAASLLPPAAAFDALGYACTSGTTLIGEARVDALIRANATTRAVCTPLAAAREAFAALGARSVGILSPYVPSVAEPIRQAFVSGGLAVPHSLSFGEMVEARVARIDPASIRAAALELGRRGDIDGLFLSCTNLRTLDIIDDLERRLGIPVVSSNQALAWQMARASGVTVPSAAPGRLFSISG